MKKLTLQSLAFASSAVLLVSTGCIHTQETVYRNNSPRTTVEFENENAGKLFYEACSFRPSKNQKESSTEVSLPFVFSHKQNVVRSQNEDFNHAVEQCDTNRDHRITELEARVFAGSWR